MATNVQTTVEIKGSDQFSAVFGKLKAGADDISKATDRAGAGTAAIGERAGNLERGFMGLKDIIGGISEGPLQQVADRMGGIEAVTQGFGAKMGLVGLAIGAVAMGATMLYERMEKARKTALDVEILRLDAIREDGEALARHLSLSQELLGVKQGIKTVEDVTGAAMEHARAILDNQKAILEAQKEKEEEKIALLEIEQARLRGLLAVDQLRLQAAKDAADVGKAVTADQVRATRQREEEEARINNIMDVRERQRQRDWYRSQQIAILENERRSLLVRQNETGEQMLRRQNRLLEVSRDLRTLEQSLRQDAAEGEATADRRRSERAAAGRAATAAAKAADEARRKALDDYYAAENQLTEKLRADAEARSADILDMQERVRRGAIALAESPADKTRLQMADLQARADRESAKIREQLAGDDERRALRLLDLDQRIATERRAIDAEARKASDEAIAKAQAERAVKVDAAMGVASAAVAGLEQIGVAEQAAAGMKAILSAAEAGLAAARGNYAGAVAGAFAAVQFGKLALTGAPTVPGASGGGGGMAQASFGQRGQQGGGGSGAVVINFNKGFYGDAATTAKGIATTLKTIGGSGIPAFKGA